MQKAKLYHLIFLLGIAWVGGEPSYADCDHIFSKVAPSSSDSKPNAFEPWKIQERNLKLSTAQLFPEAFVKEVESKKGPFSLRLEYLPTGRLRINGEVAGRVYVHVTLIPDETKPESISVDGLVLENPLAPQAPNKLNADQLRKGLPIEVFLHVKNQMIEMLKAGGYRRMVTDSQQHFGVVMLYKRAIGMEPSTEASKAIMEEIQALYSFARKELPEEYRPDSVDAFTRLIGSAWNPPEGYTSKRNQILNQYFQTGQLPENVQIIKDKTGKEICALFHENPNQKTGLLFLTHRSNRPEIFKWSDIAFSHSLELSKDF